MIAHDTLDCGNGTTNTNEIWSRNLQLREKKYTYLHATLELFVNDLQVSVATTVGKIIVASKCNYAITKKKNQICTPNRQLCLQINKMVHYLS